MATKADGYRAKAAECDRQANRANNPVVRQRYVDAANVWRMLADHVDLVIELPQGHKTGSLISGRARPATAPATAPPP